jgi:perosamine synthetase
MNMEKIIQTAGPSITQKEIDYVLDAVKNGWYENWNGYLNKFEKKFSEYIGTSHAIPTSSCTGALHLALAALGIRKGDEVIVPETSWVATAAVVTYVQAKPVFVDIDPESFTINPDCIESAITRKTKAILPVHLYGHPADMDPILDIAHDHGLAVIEDAAPSIGAEYKGRKTGSLGDIAGFSFQGAKLMVTGEGGMLVTNDDKIFERAASLANQGRDPKIPFKINEIGLKYKMSNLQAALGLAQLERIDELIDKKRQIFNWYFSRLSEVPEIQLSLEKKWTHSIHWMTSIILSNSLSIKREDLRSELLEKRIDTRPIFPPMSSFPMFKKMNHPVAEFVGKRGINLPCASNLTEEQVNYVCEELIRVLKQAS